MKMRVALGWLWCAIGFLIMTGVGFAIHPSLGVVVLIGFPVALILEWNRSRKAKNVETPKLSRRRSTTCRTK